MRDGAGTPGIDYLSSGCVLLYTLARFKQTFEHAYLTGLEEPGVLEYLRPKVAAQKYVVPPTKVCPYLLVLSVRTQ